MRQRITAIDESMFQVCTIEGIDYELRLEPHQLCIIGGLSAEAEEATYMLVLPPAGVSEGAILTINVTVMKEDAVMRFVCDGFGLGDDALGVGGKSLVAYCDGVRWWTLLEMAEYTAIKNKVPFPTDGTTGQVLMKKSDVDYDVEWVTPTPPPNPLPIDGTTGQVLAKKTDDDYDVEWVTPA